MKLNVLFENDAFIAIAKPTGMLSVPDRKQSEPSLKDLLKQQYPEIYAVHRLDKATSGLIIFAKQADVHKELSRLFESRTVEKYYIGLVQGNIQPEAGLVETGIMEHPAKNGKMVVNVKGKPAKTGYKTLEAFREYALMEFQIYTGRTHQIRVHAHYLGHAVVADPLYGDGHPLLLSSIKKNYNLAKSQDDEQPIMPRLALHAHRIAFRLKETDYRIECPIPKDIQATVRQLQKHNGRR